MTYSSKIKAFIVLVIVFAVLGRVGLYYLDKKYDAWHRPWAYSDDPNKPLLVGKWAGEYSDPDNIVHKIEMEVFVPTTDEERWRKLNRPHGGRSGTNPRFFDGMALIETQGKQDSFELWGGLDKADGAGLDFQMRPVNGVYPVGFNLNQLKGNWTGDKIRLTIAFALHRADGSSYYDSADPRHNTEGTLLLSRVK